MISAVALRVFWTCFVLFIAMMFCDSLDKHDSDPAIRLMNKTKRTRLWIGFVGGLAIIVGLLALVIGLSTLIWGF